MLRTAALLTAPFLLPVATAYAEPGPAAPYCSSYSLGFTCYAGPVSGRSWTGVTRAVVQTQNGTTATGSCSAGPAVVRLTATDGTTTDVRFTCQPGIHDT